MTIKKNLAKIIVVNYVNMSIIGLIILMEVGNVEYSTLVINFFSFPN